jgi:RluA family pseudouridine synthase
MEVPAAGDMDRGAPQSDAGQRIWVGDHRGTYRIRTPKILDPIIQPQKKLISLNCLVDSHRSGWTVVAYLSHRFKYHTESGWEKRVRDKWVRVNGENVDPTHIISEKDDIQYSFMHAEPPVDFGYDVLYEDDHIFAVSKSGSIPVHACGVFITHTLIAKLRKDFGPSASLCHRLDRETSGIVIVAKTKEANREMAGLFARGQVSKKYYAVVVGEVEKDSFEVDAPIGKVDVRYQYPDEYEYGKANDLATYLPKRNVDFENGKPARTGFEVVDRNDGFSLLRVTPMEGRTNQIRVHLWHAGYPIVGDKIYMLDGPIRDRLLREGESPEVKKALIAERHLLHSYSLAFPHPITKEPMTVIADLPADFQAINLQDRNL